MRRLVGQNLKRIRLKKGLTQEQFADISGFSQQYISGLEGGHPQSHGGHRIRNSGRAGCQSPRPAAADKEIRKITRLPGLLPYPQKMDHDNPQKAAENVALNANCLGRRCVLKIPTCARCSGRLLPPSPPAEKATARRPQGNTRFPQGRAVPRRAGGIPG
jgi:Helix-turn-helix